ncbi:MAG: sulfite exporter TauE/SafE family protein [Candidatus Lokiarchaeota archaeon]|nr:sulfite exporter TauE/SafE family protein [Candidatus Lokiarchaeota archaeon]
MFEYLIIFLPAFLLGILHTVIPCEDKAIFFFWSFGISKTPRRSLNILVLYGFGLISSNLIIATGTILISLVPRLIAPGLIFNPYAINFFGAVVSMFAGIFLLVFVTTRNYMPHSKQSKDIGTLDWEKNQTPYLFGIIAGFAPCIFELIIYTQCLQYSLGYGFIEGVLIVFYFSLGTFVGLFPLALAKYGTSQIVKSKENRKNTVFVLMILIIVVFNAAVMILSFLEISVFPLQNI